MKKFLLLLGFLGAFMLHAQQFNVVETQLVRTNGAHFHPQFMPNGQSLLVTSENFDGLGIINLSNGGYKQLTNMRGAGYMPAIQNDGKTVVFRSANLFNDMMTLHAINTANLQSRQIGQAMEHINRLNVVAGDVCYAVNGKVQRCQVLPRGAVRTSNNQSNVYVTEEDLKVVLYNNGKRTVIDPLSTIYKDVNYCWSSLSPNKKKVLFVGGDEAYTCNLDGSGLVKLGKIHAPVWRGNDFVVGMADEDDGHQFTKSDIVIIGANGKNFQKLTQASKEIKMYPAVSADGSKIAYHTTDGRIYLMTIKQK